MIRRFLPVLFISLLAFTCKKKHEIPVTEDPVEVKLPDEIVYYDLTPDKSIQSVRYYQSYNNCYNVIPFPGDSAVSYDLDLNSDQVADFRFGAGHNPRTGTEYCGHCPGSDYFIGLGGLLPGDSIAVQNSSPGFRNFKESDLIDQNNIWVSGSSLLYQHCTFSWDFSDGYIGVKVGKSFGYIRVKKLPNNGIQILEYALNKTGNNSISCGQK